MRWIKHLAESANDEKLASLLAAHGPEGYGVWWLVVETIAKQIGPKSMKISVTYPVSYWIRITHIYHHKKFRGIIQSMHNLLIIFALSLRYVRRMF